MNTQAMNTQAMNTQTVDTQTVNTQAVTGSVPAGVKGVQMNVDSRKSPFLAGFLSMFPGLGQVYVGYYIHGFVVMLIFASTIAVASTGSAPGLEPLLGIFLAFFWFFNIIDASRKAGAYNRSAMGEKDTVVLTDSPLVGGSILLGLGILLTLRVTFDIDFEFLENIWPLGLVLGGGYLIWRYRRTQRELQSHRPNDAWMAPPPPPPPPAPPSPMATSMPSSMPSSASMPSSTPANPPREIEARPFE